MSVQVITILRAEGTPWLGTETEHFTVRLETHGLHRTHACVCIRDWMTKRGEANYICIDVHHRSFANVPSQIPSLCLGLAATHLWVLSQLSEKAPKLCSHGQVQTHTTPFITTEITASFSLHHKSFLFGWTQTDLVKISLYHSCQTKVHSIPSRTASKAAFPLWAKAREVERGKRWRENNEKRWA